MERTTTSKHLYLMALKLTSTWHPQWFHVWLSKDAPVNVLWLNLLLGFSNKPSGDFRWFKFCKTRHNLSFNPAFPPTSWSQETHETSKIGWNNILFKAVSGGDIYSLHQTMTWNHDLECISNWFPTCLHLKFTFTKKKVLHNCHSAIRIPGKPNPALKTHGPARIWPSCFLTLEGYHSVCVLRYLKSYYMNGMWMNIIS